MADAAFWNIGIQMFSSTSWNSKCPSFRSPNQDVLQTVSTTARYDLRRLQGCHVGWFGGIGADFQVERVCLRLTKNRSWWHTDPFMSVQRPNMFPQPVTFQRRVAVTISPYHWRSWSGLHANSNPLYLQMAKTALF
jgi:hypothetical protein